MIDALGIPGESSPGQIIIYEIELFKIHFQGKIC